MTSRAGRGWVHGAMAIVAVSALACALAAPSASAAPGPVMPPTATPHGTSLTDMTRALAAFTASGNTLPVPETPFEILYIDPPTVASELQGGGLIITGSNSFTVRTGASFYVPILNADDSPPVVGMFPTRQR